MSIRDLIVCLSSTFTVFQPVSHNIVKEQDPTYGVDLKPHGCMIEITNIERCIAQPIIATEMGILAVADERW